MKGNFKLVITTAGAAFDNAPEHTVADLLRRVADELSHNGTHEPGSKYMRTIRDGNGNRCGSWTLKF